MNIKRQHIFIMGDFHGDWRGVNAFINKRIRQSNKLKAWAAEGELEVVILQCGDFGYWPHTEASHTFFDAPLVAPEGEDDTQPYGIKNKVDFVKDGLVKIYWCDGNHENHDVLDTLEREYSQIAFIPVMPGVYFARFGAVLTLQNGISVLFCGGARSDDKEQRIPGKEWWPQEEVDQHDIACLPAATPHAVQWVVSHTCPMGFAMESPRKPEKLDDPSRNFLEEIRRRFMPERWWFGHYHTYATGNIDDCEWKCLDYINHGRHWLEEITLELIPER